MPVLTPNLLDASLPTPLYHQIFSLLREMICRGEAAPGSLLPGEQEMARQLNVSRITVKRALNDLASDNLVSRHRGRGTIVASGIAVPVVRGSFDNLIESLRLLGMETEVELIDVSPVDADADAAAALRVPEGAPLYRIVRRRKVQGEPFAYLVSLLPASIGEKFSRDELSHTPLLTLLERVGATCTEAEQWIVAAHADAATAAALDVEEGSPVLQIARLMTSASGEVVQLIHSAYRSDRFQYHVRTHSRRPAAVGATSGWRPGPQPPFIKAPQ